MFNFIARFFGLFTSIIDLLEINLDSLKKASNIGNAMAGEAEANAVIDRKLATARKRAEQAKLAAELNIAIE